MPKIFDRQFEGLYQPKRINEDVWFERFQESLLWLANTDFGRELLCIDKNFPIISEIGKNRIVTDLGNGKKLAEFRVGSKYANIIRFSWDKFCNAMQGYQPVYGLMFFNTPVLSSKNRYSTTTFYPEPHVETTTVDGWVRETYSTGGAKSWTTIRNGSGNASDDATASTEAIYITSDSITNKWRRNTRSIYLFDTSSITSANAVSAATFSVSCSVKTDNLGIAPTFNIYSSNPASNNDLVNGDYVNTGTVAYASNVTYAGVSTVAYTDFSFNATGIAAVNVSGITKLSLKNANYDVANSDPSWSSDQDTYLTCFFADTALTTSDPKLTVVYDVAPNNYTKTLDETITLDLLSTKNIAKSFSEVITLVEEQTKSMTKTLGEIITLVDTIESSFFYSRDFDETLLLLDTLEPKIIAKMLEEMVTAVDTINRDVTRILNETSVLVDTLSIQIQLHKSFDEAVAIVDDISKATGKALAELIELTDTFLKSAVFSRTLNEISVIVDTISKGAKKVLNEATALVDTFSRVGVFGRIFAENLTLIEKFQGLINGINIRWFRKYATKTMAFTAKYSTKTVTWVKKYLDIP